MLVSRGKLPALQLDTDACMDECSAPASTPVTTCLRITICCILLLGFRVRDDVRYIYTWPISKTVASSYPSLPRSIQQSFKHGSPTASSTQCESSACAITFPSDGLFFRRLTSSSMDTSPCPLAPKMPRAIFATCLG